VGALAAVLLQTSRALATTAPLLGLPVGPHSLLLWRVCDAAIGVLALLTLLADLLLAVPHLLGQLTAVVARVQVHAAVPALADAVQARDHSPFAARWHVALHPFVDDVREIVIGLCPNVRMRLLG
tara:strand:+ start:1935 stop:2309 length:375 start_codon:yes stop_codon:yes gene_type:complete